VKITERNLFVVEQIKCVNGLWRDK